MEPKEPIRLSPGGKYICSLLPTGGEVYWIPACAGRHTGRRNDTGGGCKEAWVPAFAGMTRRVQEGQGGPCVIPTKVGIQLFFPGFPLTQE